MSKVRMSLFVTIGLLMFVGISTFFIMGIHSSQDITDERFNKVVYQPTSFMFFERTLEGLESRSSTIVRGRLGDDARIVFQYTDPFNPDTPTMGNNMVSLEIVEVIHGGRGLSVGETIKLIEPYYILDEVLFTWDNYLPSIPHQEYIFFLTDPRPDTQVEEFRGAFWVQHGERGRFLIPSDIGVLGFEEGDMPLQDFSARDLSLGSYADLDLYMRLWKEVLGAYVNSP